jgi:hypothetical protein
VEGMFSRVAGREREGGGVRYQHLEEIVLVQARELKAQRADLERASRRIRELESKMKHQREEYRRGYQAGWVARGRRVPRADHAGRQG